METGETSNNNSKITLSDQDILDFITPTETDSPESIDKKVRCFRHLQNLIGSLRDPTSWGILHNILGDYIQLVDEDVIDAWMEINV